ncbi:tRNA (adenosine(37)-N6)-dimethylallyltransferase MiaA [Hydrogenothermus marinus]|uniref:tRNA dimethylallyltransferase n=1 Tax=Hydrogenothermus marinus TaxID=133270 RepID=A0A3M0BK34_9AQUI|nr:tRNA (adenosine(37)-N6)-dimethylallyltransferase MiaA [Hydrogenothermus marinus]RMA97690.1 tRNA dimethylallyltransferase [Hydrogenothermus marinus]
MNKLIIITGTTATGKTETAINLAKEIDGEIISADSMMVYKYMDIGTAKPTKEEMEGIPHYLIDIRYPNEFFDVKDFISLAKEKIKEITEKGKTAIVVGGTWLYINSLLYGLSEIPTADWNLRNKLYKESSELLYEKLKEVDPVYAEKIHPNDKKRVVRALEVYYLTGKPFSSFHKNEDKPLYDFIGFVFERDRNQIMERIEKRVDKMIEKGLLDEVKFLLDKGYENSITSMQAIGYKELIPYFKGKCSLEEAKENIIKNTKAFAKRQIRTFRKKFKDDKWYFIDIKDEYNLVNYILEIIKRRK